MQRTLEEKIADIKKTLQSKCVDKLAQFDVKNGEEDGNPYHRAYLDKTKADMGALFKKDAWADLDSWEKLCCYKISGSKGVDCDAALRSTVIYQMAFGYDSPKIEQYKQGYYQLQCREFTLHGDTMNSYNTTVHEFLRTYGHEEDRVAGFLVKVGNVWGTRNLADANWEVCILENYEYFSKIIPPAAKEFFRLYHTVGNFCPIPNRLNNPRGYNSNSKDYWDLALLCIYYDYCQGHNLKYTLEWLFKKDAGLCRDWLKNFGEGQSGWDNFVERNFLQDFVNQTDGHYGPPKELWKGHFTNSVMPPKADFDQFFTNASAWIAARGIRIALAVKAALAAEKDETGATKLEATP